MSRASVVLTGNVGRDADIRSVGNSWVATFPVATTSRKKIRDEWADVATWWRCTAFGNNKDRLAQLIKGTAVRVEGEAFLDEWESQNGDKKQTLSVRVSYWEFNGRRTEESRTQAPQREQPMREPVRTAPQPDYDDDIPF